MTKAQGTSGTGMGAAAGALTVVGVVLIAAFFAPWIDIHGELKLSGWWLANHDAAKLFVVPVLGLALVAAGVTRSRYLPIIAALAALIIVGTTAYHTVRSVLKFEYGTLLTLLGGAVALAGISDERRGLRALGGALALAGFFLPWGAGESAWAILRSDDADLARALGISMSALWAIPCGAIAALAATVAGKPSGGNLAAAGGVLVLGGFFWFLGSAVNLVAGWGAWTTLGAGVAAGVLGLIGAATGAGKR